MLLKTTMTHDDLVLYTAKHIAPLFEPYLVLVDLPEEVCAENGWLSTRIKGMSCRRDVKVWTKAWRVVGLECKVSESDARAEAKKNTVDAADETWIVVPDEIRSLWPPVGWGMYINCGGDQWDRYIDPAETCLDQPDMRGGAWLHCDNVAVLLKLLSRMKPRKNKGNVTQRLGVSIELCKLLKKAGPTPVDDLRAAFPDIDFRELRKAVKHNRTGLIEHNGFWRWEDAAA